MRKRDLAALILGWGLFLAGLAWALSTQHRWVQENKPIQRHPLGSAGGASGPKASAPPKVMGPITDDTRDALLKELRARNAQSPRPTPAGGKPPGADRR